MNKPTAAQLKDPQWWGVWAPEDATHYSEYYGAFVKPFDSEQWVVLRQGPKPVVTFMDTGIFMRRPESSVDPVPGGSMEIDIERLKCDRKYWDSVSVPGRTYYDKESGFFCDEKGYYTDYGFKPWSVINPGSDEPGRFIPRPAKPASPEWDGIGLPPVGCECKVAHHGHWIPAKIIAHGEDHGEAVAFCQTEYLPLIGDATQFRPIRTQAERDRESSVNAALKTFSRTVSQEQHTLLSGFAMELYDAGMLRRADK
jgi:hypothetical protein